MRRSGFISTLIKSSTGPSEYFSKLLSARGLQVNVYKCAVFVFCTCKSEHQNSNIRLVGSEIKRVQIWIYVDITLTENVSIVSIVDMALKRFLRQFNAVYQNSKLYHKNAEGLCFLFCTYTAYFYSA